MLILRFMIKPSRAYTRIGFSRHPCVTVFQAIMEHWIGSIPRFVKQTPVGFSYISGFGTHPSQIAAITTVIPYYGFRLKFTYQLIGFRPLIVGSAVNGSYFISPAIPSVTSICAIKPNFKNFSIICQQFTQLISEI